MLNVLITCGGMVYNAVELMVVLANLATIRRHGESCSRPGAASRVAYVGTSCLVAVRMLTRGCD
jgi:hypothetical protein